MAEKKKDEVKSAQLNIEKTLKEAVGTEMGELPELSITVDELRSMEDKRQKKKKKKFVRLVSTAAIAVVVCAAALYLAWPDSAVPVDADKDAVEKIETGQGDLVLNNGEGVGDSNIVEYIISDEKYIEVQREKFPEMAIPKYVPDGYEFKKLHIESYGEDDFQASFKYINKGKKELYIDYRHYMEGGVATTSFDAEETDTEESKKGMIYLLKEKGEPTLSILNVNNNSITVTGQLNNKEMVKIFDKIEMP